MSSVVTNTILKLSEERLSTLQKLFNERPDGLNEHEFVEVMGKVLDIQKEMECLLPDSRNSVALTEEASSIDNAVSFNEDDDEVEEGVLRQQVHQNKLRTVNTVAELCELFGQVDSCGEGTIKWETFSYFLIRMGATGGIRDMVFDDEFERRCIYGTRTSEDKYLVRAIRYCPVLHRVFVCVDDRVDVMDLYPSNVTSPSNLDTLGEKGIGGSDIDRMLLQSIKIKVPVKDAEKVTDTGMKLKEGPRDSGPKLKLKCLDCVFIESDNFELYRGEAVKPAERATDLRPSPTSPPGCFRALVVLSSDASLSFFRFGRLNQLGIYEVVPAGRCDLPLQQLRLEWCSAASSLFSCGFDGEVRCWKVHYHGIASISLTGGASAERAKMLEGTFTLDQAKETSLPFTGASKKSNDDGGFKPDTVAKPYFFSGSERHTDVVGCFALCSFGTHKETGEAEVLLLASGGLDRKIIIWDPLTLTYQYELKPRHAAGVTCLSWDAHQGLLLSSSFDTTVQGFVLISSKLFPLFSLVQGHAHPVVSVSCAIGGCRAVSVDTSGGVRWWDTRKECMLEDNERLLCKASTQEASSGAVAVFGNDAATQYSANGISIVVVGRRLQLFDSRDVSARNPAPSSMLFGGASMTIATTFGAKIAVWDALTGDLSRMLDMKDKNKALEHGDGELTCIALDGNDVIGDRRVVCGNLGGGISTVDYLTGSVLAHLPPHEGQVTGLITTQSGLAVSISTDGDLRVYDIRATGRPHVTTSELLLRVVKNCHGVGPVSSLGVSEVLNTCCTGAGASLRIWDFEFFSLEAQFPQATLKEQCLDVSENSASESPSISAIVFLEPYPVVVCGDSSGHLTAFLLKDGVMKDQSSGYRRLIRWKNFKQSIFKTDGMGEETSTMVEDSDEARDITALEVSYDANHPHGERLYLYASDKRGTMVVHDMLPFLNSLEIRAANVKSNIVHQVRRRVTKDMKETSSSKKSNVSEVSAKKFAHVAKDFSHISDVDHDSQSMCDDVVLPTLIDDWVGHEDSVVAMMTIKKPYNMLLSASADGHIKLWSARPPTDADRQADDAYRAAVAKAMIPAINLKKKKRHSLPPPPPPPLQHTLLGILTKGQEDRQLLLRESEMFRAADEKHRATTDVLSSEGKRVDDRPKQRSGRAACGMPPWRFPPNQMLAARAKQMATNTLVQGREAQRRLDAMMFARAQAEHLNTSNGGEKVVLDERLGAAASTLSDPKRQDQVTRLLGQFFFGDKSWKQTKFEIAKEEAERQVALQKTNERRGKSRGTMRNEHAIGRDAELFLHPKYDASTMDLIEDAKKDREKATKDRLLAAIDNRPGSSAAIQKRKKKAQAVLNLDPELTSSKEREKKHYPTYYSEVGRKGGYTNKSRVKSLEELKELMEPSAFLKQALPLACKPSKRKSQKVQRSVLEITEVSVEEAAQVKQMPSLLYLNGSVNGSITGSQHSLNRPKVINDQALVAKEAEMHREWQDRVAAGLSIDQGSVGSRNKKLVGSLGTLKSEEMLTTNSLFFGPYDRDQVSLLYNACGNAYKKAGYNGAPLRAPIKGTLLDLKRVQDEVVGYAQEEVGDVGDWLSIIADLQRRYLGKGAKELGYDQIKVTTDEIVRAIFPLLRSHETQDAIDTLSKLWNMPVKEHVMSEEEQIEAMPPHVVSSLRRLFELFDIRRNGYVSSREVAAALRSSSNATDGSFDISTMVATSEMERLASYFEGSTTQDSITSGGVSEGNDTSVDDEALHRSQSEAGSDSESVDDINGEEVARKGGIPRKPREFVDRKVSEVEFILAFRGSL